MSDTMVLLSEVLKWIAETHDILLYPKTLPGFIPEAHRGELLHLATHSASPHQLTWYFEEPKLLCDQHASFDAVLNSAMYELSDNRAEEKVLRIDLESLVSLLSRSGILSSPEPISPIRSLPCDRETFIKQSWEKVKGEVNAIPATVALADSKAKRPDDGPTGLQVDITRGTPTLKEVPKVIVEHNGKRVLPGISPVAIGKSMQLDLTSGTVPDPFPEKKEVARARFKKQQDARLAKWKNRRKTIPKSKDLRNKVKK